MTWDYHMTNNPVPVPTDSVRDEPYRTGSRVNEQKRCSKTPDLSTPFTEKRKTGVEDPVVEVLIITSVIDR